MAWGICRNSGGGLPKIKSGVLNQQTIGNGIYTFPAGVIPLSIHYNVYLGDYNATNNYTLKLNGAVLLYLNQTANINGLTANGEISPVGCFDDLSNIEGKSITVSKSNWSDNITLYIDRWIEK